MTQTHNTVRKLCLLYVSISPVSPTYMQSSTFSDILHCILQSTQSACWPTRQFYPGNSHFMSSIVILILHPCFQFDFFSGFNSAFTEVTVTFASDLKRVSGRNTVSVRLHIRSISSYKIVLNHIFQA